MIFLGKFAGAAMTETLTIYTLIRKKTILDVINGYIATFLIGKIGNVMASTLYSFDVDGEMSSKRIYFEKNTYFMDDLHKINYWRNSEQMNFIQWVGMVAVVIVNRAARLSYNIFYFYFIPFFVVVLVQIHDFQAFRAVGETH